MTNQEQQMMNGGADPLAEIDGAFQEAEAPAGFSNEDLPDGHYQCRIVDMDIAESATSGNLLLKWDMEVLVGPHAGRKVWKNNVIAKKAEGTAKFAADDSIKYLKGDLARVGITLAALTDLRTRKDEVKGKCVEVALKTRGTFQACFINKVIEPVGGMGVGAVPAGETGVATGEAGDVPF